VLRRSFSTASSGAGVGAAGNIAVTEGFCAADGRVLHLGCFPELEPPSRAATFELLPQLVLLSLQRTLSPRRFFPLPFTKTVKTPGVSSTVAVPAAIGRAQAIAPNQIPTLKLARGGLVWQSDFLPTHT